MKTEKFDNYCIDVGPMGPIGEGGALMLRATRNCPWNRCLFCGTYKGKKFELRSVSEIKRDIDTVKTIEDLIKETSWKIGLAGRISQEVINEIVWGRPEIYGRDDCNLTAENYIARRSLLNVVTWLVHGARRVFLQDANSLIMRPRELVEVLEYLKETFPTVETVTSYARSKTCAQRSLEELKEIKEAGLSWLFVGIESGCDEVLDYMQKGVTAREHITGGQKVMEAGINLAAFVMPGLAGKNRELSEKHVLGTIKVLNEVKPTEVRIRSLAILESSPLFLKWESGDFEAPTEDQMIDEIKQLIEGLNFDCVFETLQMTNVLFNIRGKLSTTKEEMLKFIDWYKSMSPMERSKYRLEKYLNPRGYIYFVDKVWHKLESQLELLIREAKESLEKDSKDAEARTEQAICTLKSKGIP